MRTENGSDYVKETSYMHKKSIKIILREEKKINPSRKLCQ